MKQGTIIRIISNQYQIYSDGMTYDAKAMGKLRKGVSPVVGDVVDFEQMDDIYGIQRIHERKNQLIRPLIANVDQAIIVMSAKDPDFSTVLIDRLIFLISYEGITPVLVITKMDMIDDPNDPVYGYIEDYKKGGYDVYTSGKAFDTKDIEAAFADKISVLTGQSGAGKSSLLNRIDDRLEIKTQAISKALGRGKHTTRHTQLFAINGGWVGDTPGFSSLDLENMDIHIFNHTVPDFTPYVGKCKFNDCIHINEPQCAVLEAVEKKEIVQYRYDHYKEVVKMIENKR